MYYDSEPEREAFFKSLFQYRMERPLGEGAFGLAVLALDETERIRKVFKLPRDSRTTEALKTEGENLVKLRGLLHNNIIQLFQFGRTRIHWNGEEHERYYLCLAYGGKSLRARLGDLKMTLDLNGNPRWDGSGQVLDVEESLCISLDVCQGLEAAHGFRGSEVRILHRDIKPENILIDEETGTARIADFGISRVIDRSTGIASAAGTLPYMDPECFQGHAGPHSDLYSLGIVMYEMLTGHLPFGDFPERLRRAAADPRELNDVIPPALSAIILKALARDAESRYANASEMLRDLRRLHAALNPLPHHLVKVEQLGPRCVICDDREAHQRVVVRLVDVNMSTDTVDDEIVRLREIGLEGVTVPLGCFRNQQVIGIVEPRSSGKPILDVVGAVPVTESSQLRHVCGLLAAVSRILARLHGAGVVHSSLSPASIHVGNNGEVVLSGLGLAPVLRDRSRIDTIVLRESFAECLPYMAYSLIEGTTQLRPCDDVFAVGAILAYFLTGRLYHGPEAVDCALEKMPFTLPAFVPRDINPLITHRLLSVMQKALGMCECDDGGYSDACQLADDLEACRWPDDLVDTWCQDAMLRYEVGDALGAYEVLERALYEAPGSSRVHFTKGLIYFREGEYKWAVPEFESAATVDPTQENHMYLARALLAQGDRINKASRAAAHALECGDGSQVRELLAEVRFAQGRGDDALSEMKHAVAWESDPVRIKMLECRLNAWRLEGRSPKP